MDKNTEKEEREKPDQVSDGAGAAQGNKPGSIKEYTDEKPPKVAKDKAAGKKFCKRIVGSDHRETLRPEGAESLSSEIASGYGHELPEWARHME